MFTVVPQDDLFNYKNFAHGCNCKGFMSAGIAGVVKRRYPDVHDAYKDLCERGQFTPGSVFAMRTGGRWVFNLATQDYPGPNARLEYIYRSIKRMMEMVPPQTQIAIPAIGCGIGGLQREDLAPVIQKLLDEEVFKNKTLIYIARGPNEFEINR